jgi:AGZA family xanthine/uracil permease-like MFS transporter
LLITLIGLEWAGLVRLDPNTFVTLGHLTSKPALVALIGVVATTMLLARKIKGAILIGIIVATIAGLLLGVVGKPEALMSFPPSIAPTAFKLDIAGAVTRNLFAVIFVFFFLDLFDTVGSLIGIAKQAGLMVEGKLPRAGRALLADAIGTMGSAVAGNTTMVSYIESAAGVTAGGRTGIAALVTAVLFLLALFFSPLVRALSGGFPIQDVISIEGQAVSRTFVLYPVTSPALIVVGSFMIKSLRDIDWDDFTEALPAFLTMVLMPLTFSVTDGIAFGFISFALLKLASGRGKEAHWLVYIFAALFVIRYAIPGMH